MSAGFTKLQPIPLNICFTTRMLKIPESATTWPKNSNRHIESQKDSGDNSAEIIGSNRFFCDFLPEIFSQYTDGNRKTGDVQ